MLQAMQRVIAQSPTMPWVVFLLLQITDVGLTYVAHQWRLVDLNLSHCMQLTDDGLQLLKGVLCIGQAVRMLLRSFLWEDHVLQTCFHLPMHGECCLFQASSQAQATGWCQMVTEAEQSGTRRVLPPVVRRLSQAAAAEPGGVRGRVLAGAPGHAGRPDCAEPEALPQRVWPAPPVRWALP